MFFFSVAIILLLIGAFWLGLVKSSARGAGFIFIVVSVFCLVFSMFTTVQAKQVGVVTTFGKVSEDTLGAGPHFKLPWQKVTEIDSTVQTDEYKGDSCITVVLSDKNTACISATNRWSVNDTNAGDVYAEFRTDDPTGSLRDAVVSTQFKAAVNDVFGGYDATQEGKADYQGLAKSVTDTMVENTDGLIDISKITISYIKPGEKLQNKIEAIQAQEAQTTIATEKIETARKEADANRILSDSISNDPNVLVSKCLDLIADGSFTPPAGFSCWPGGGGGVVIPSAAK